MLFRSLDAVLGRVAGRYRDDLAPAIERVWDDGVASVRADLRTWLGLTADAATAWVPWRFELSFGLPVGRRNADPASSAEPVQLDIGVRLRGSIDLVEKSRAGAIRATDHKTGRVRAQDDTLVGGGETLQPVLYALALEKLVPGTPVESGRLYYCTQTGKFTPVEIRLGQEARDSARAVVEAIGDALEEGFLPAAPNRGACTYCDYASVCGPNEELRTRRKRREPLAALSKLRGLK